METIPTSIIIKSVQDLSSEEQYTILIDLLLGKFQLKSSDDRVKLIIALCQSNIEICLVLFIKQWNSNNIASNLRKDILKFILSKSSPSITQLMKTIGKIYEKCDEFELAYIKNYTESYISIFLPPN